MKRPLLEVGPLELEVLGSLNEDAEHSVADIQKKLKQSGRDLAYTTVMTVLVRLHSKGMVQRRKENRSYLYSGGKKHESSPRGIFEKVKRSLFGTERLKPILSLLDGEDRLSRSELEELKKAVDERLKRR